MYTDTGSSRRKAARAAARAAAAAVNIAAAKEADTTINDAAGALGPALTESGSSAPAISSVDPIESPPAATD